MFLDQVGSEIVRLAELPWMLRRHRKRVRPRLQWLRNFGKALADRWLSLKSLMTIR